MLKHTLAIGLLLLPTILIAQAPQPPAASAPQSTQSQTPKAQIQHLEQELKSLSKESNPKTWAELQLKIGACWAGNNEGDWTENAVKAVGAFNNALTVFTPQANPRQWTQAQLGLAGSLSYLPYDDEPQRIENKKSAIAAAEKALAVATRENDSENWGYAQIAIGNVWQSIPGENDTQTRQNQLKAIAAFEAAFIRFAENGNNARCSEVLRLLSFIRIHGFKSGPEKSIQDQTRSIAYLSAAQNYLSKDTDLSQWVDIQLSIAADWQWMQPPDGPERKKNLMIAAMCYDSALKASSGKITDWSIWGDSFSSYAAVWEEMPAASPQEKFTYLQKQVSVCKFGLGVINRKTHPDNWAALHISQASAFAQMATYPDQDRAALLRSAIASDKAALSVFKSPSPDIKPNTKYLDEHRKAYESAGFDQQVPFDSIKPAQ